MRPKTRLTEEELASLGKDHAIYDAYVKQDDGSYLLTVDSNDGRKLEDTEGLRSALAKERSAKKKAEDKLVAFGELEPEEARRAIAAIADVESSTEEKTKKAIEEIKAQLATKHTKELGERDGQIKDLTGQLQHHLVVSAATAALAENKGNTRLLLPHVVGQVRMIKDADGKFVSRVVDEKGNERISQRAGSTDPMEVAELVELMREDPNFQVGFAGVEASGAGSESSNGSAQPRGNVMKIRSSDQDAINNNHAKIASGEAIVVEG